jgi:hypothetical protein
MLATPILHSRATGIMLRCHLQTESATLPTCCHTARTSIPTSLRLDFAQRGLLAGLRFERIVGRLLGRGRVVVTDKPTRVTNMSVMYCVRTRSPFAASFLSGVYRATATDGRCSAHTATGRFGLTVRRDFRHRLEGRVSFGSGGSGVAVHDFNECGYFGVRHRELLLGSVLC